MLDNEKTLIKAAKEGDTRSFSDLYDHYLPKIYRFILLKVSIASEAEDLCHDTFLSAWQNLPNYQERGFPFSSWLYHIARNKIIDHYRTRKQNLDLETVDESFLKIVGVVEHNADVLLEFNKAKHALRDLKEDQQEVIIMRYLEDLSYKEIAKALEKSEGAVRILQHRAIQNLKKILKENPNKNLV